jgi:hypothetical protein
VSCRSAAACTAVGEDGNNALAETWNGSKWTVSAALNGGNGATQSQLNGVSCPSATALCTAVGYYEVSGPSLLTLGEGLSNGGASRGTTPSPGRTVSLLNGVSCTSAQTCWAVGFYDTFRGVRVTLGEFWNGFNWSFGNVPEPNGGFTPSFLNGVSCASTGPCTAVGEYQNGGTFVTLAERFTPSS